jgi:hypothetical protein
MYMAVWCNPKRKQYKAEEVMDMLVDSLPHWLYLEDNSRSMNEDKYLAVVKPFLVFLDDLVDYNV